MKPTATPTPLHLAALALAVVSVGFVIADTRPSGPVPFVSCSEAAAGCATGDAATEAVVRDTAPDFTLPTADGGSVTLSYLLAERPVLLDFWASWCPHCQRNMPRLQELHARYGDRVAILGVNMKEDGDAVRAFLASRGITYPIALDAGAVARAYGVRFTNTHVLIRQDGAIVDVRAGDISAEGLERLLADE
jgi:cytochrome c biogenesis protein CcmG, thiol:disulfide interchange protein DsbE